MSDHDLFKVHQRMPKKVRLGDITVRDGFQHEESWIPTEAKIYYLQELALAGVKRLEATNLGNPRIMPQFKDAEEVLKGIRDEFFVKRLSGKGIKPEDIEWTAVTIREPGVDRAIRLKQQGYGPDRVLMMVTTDEQHHFANSGTTLPEYWKEAERCIKKCKDAGIKMCGTVSTIWGSPISGPTRFEDAVEFTKRWLSIGADDIEHADHDGSAPPNQVYRYYSMSPEGGGLPMSLPRSRQASTFLRARWVASAGSQPIFWTKSPWREQAPITTGIPMSSVWPPLKICV
jgi:hydroxymethylglutaryl-CoA lyase